MKEITGDLLQIVSQIPEGFTGAYNIREDGGCAGRQSTENIEIKSKADLSGIEIHVKPNTKGETVYIPACITKAGVDDLVYNDFFIGEGADVTVVAGCGVHSAGHETAQHNGIHRFFVGKNARVVYKEKHIAIGTGTGEKNINPVTDCQLDEGAYLEMDTVQLSGVTSSLRKTSAVLAARANLVVRERIMTNGTEYARTDFDVQLNGEGCGADLVSRSVARGNSRQEFYSNMLGNAACMGHSECDAILAENGRVLAMPGLDATCTDAELIHEAAIGKIAGEQILKLRTLGLTEEQAEQRIIQGFLK